jgi:hypothetical protein
VASPFCRRARCSPWRFFYSTQKSARLSPYPRYEPSPPRPQYLIMHNRPHRIYMDVRMIRARVIVFLWIRFLSLLYVQVCLCVSTCISIFQLKPSVSRQVAVAAIALPFLPFCYFRMNTLEWRSAILAIAFQISGMLTFVNEYPSPWPKVFGEKSS